jgi:uncharacterized protein YpiB (UPF0302 family)
MLKILKTCRSQEVLKGPKIILKDNSRSMRDFNNNFKTAIFLQLHFSNLILLMKMDIFNVNIVMDLKINLATSYTRRTVYL